MKLSILTIFALSSHEASSKAHSWWKNVEILFSAIIFLNQRVKKSRINEKIIIFCNFFSEWLRTGHVQIWCKSPYCDEHFHNKAETHVRCLWLVKTQCPRTESTYLYVLASLFNNFFKNLLLDSIGKPICFLDWERAV